MIFPLASWSLFFHSVFYPRAVLAHQPKLLAAPAFRPQPRMLHEADPVVAKRQIVTPPAQLGAESAPSPASGPQVLSYVTPSPSATPIAITSQSQVVQSYVPLVTICPLPPLAYVSGTLTSTSSRGPFVNSSNEMPAGMDSCSTSYSPTDTTVCATTLTGLASKVTITSCSQDVTFSTDHGYTLEIPSASSSPPNASNTATPTIRDLTTYYVAAWQELAATPGVAPSNVDVKICSTYSNGSNICNTEYETWRVVNVTVTTTTTTRIDLYATYSGPGTLVIATAEFNITDTLTTFSLSTSMEIESEVGSESTSAGPRITSTSSPDVAIPTVTSTLTVVYNTNENAISVSPMSLPWQTTTVPVTSTVFEGTSTATITPAVSADS